MKPVEPEDAATVLLLREGENGLEVYMTRRREELIFLGGFHVFPGGKVDPEDKSPEMLARCRGRDPEAARGCLEGVEDPARAAGFMVAAARELFEEAGILLACNQQGEELKPDISLSARLYELRAALQAGKMTFLEILQRENLFCALDRLLFFAHWVTPATSPRRFCTYFFAARKPEAQNANPFQKEVSSAEWVRPAEALARWKRGEWKMIPPTISSLDTLSKYDRWRDLERDLKKPPSQFKRTVWKGL